MNRFIIYLLALGAFLVGTAELIVAGVLNVIAQDLDISIALAGQLITAFSLSFAIGTPIVITLTSRVIILWIGSVFVTGPAIQTYFVQKAPESSNLIISLNTSIIHLGVAIGAGAGGVLTNSTSTVGLSSLASKHYNCTWFSREYWFFFKTKKRGF